MFNIENFTLNFSYSGFFFILAVIAILVYSFYNYRYTVPMVSPSKRWVLVILRAFALIIVVLIIFEPIVSYTKKEIIEPVTLIFVDNSRSIKIDDGTNREENTNDILNSSLASIKGNTDVLTFGNHITQVEADSLNQQLSFNEGSTNFSNIFSYVSKSRENISSVLILSDGIITEGSSPLFTAEKLRIPFFTVGIGDSSLRRDIALRNALFNEYIYAGTPTSIIAAVENSGFEGGVSNFSLYENDRLVEQKQITFENNKSQNISFTYIPANGGEKKLTLSVSPLEGEFTTANNKKIFYINVLSNKLKILLLAGAPSPDLSFIRDVLSQEPNFEIHSITYISKNKTLEQVNVQRVIDSSDIFFLIGYPTSAVQNEVLTRTTKQITENNKPFFFILTDIVDLPLLRSFSGELPFSISRIAGGFSEVQPDIKAEEFKNPLLQGNVQNPIESWNNLPPVMQMNADFTPKPESDVLSGIKVNNIPINRPLILTRRLGNKRSIAVTAKDLWKWKLQTANKNNDLFDHFILSSVKWLNMSEEEKQVTIRTTKKVYALGEKVEFTAQVYDQTFNPVSDAEVTVKITGSEKSEISFNSLGNGLYEGIYETNKPGDYSFSGTASTDGKLIGSDNGRFNIGEVDIELSNPRMNYGFLSSLADRTNGKSYVYNNYQEVFDQINKINQQAVREKVNKTEIDLWSSEWLLSLTILLFAIEWFIRKRTGML